MDNFRFKLSFDTFRYSFKRKESSKKILYSILAIFVSIIIAGCITAMVGYNPFEMISKLFSKAFEYEPKKLLYNIAIFALAGLSFSFAFKANIFNIGISGQMFSAGITMLIISSSLSKFNLSPFLGQIISFMTCILTASFFAWIIAALDRYLKVNPVVSGILLNWILYLIGFFVVSAWYPNTLEGNAVMTGSIDIPEEFRLSWGQAGSWLPIIVLTLIIAISMFIIFKFTAFGKKMISIGLSSDGSKYAGFNVPRIKMVTFIISGAIAGVMALVLYTTQVPEIPLTDLNVSVPTEGFNGIAIGLLASNNPIGIIFVSGILGLFKTSSSYLWEKPVFNEVIIGVLILVIVIFTLLEKYKPWYWILNKKYKSNLNDEYSKFELKLNELISLNKIKISEIKKDKNLSKEEKREKIYILKNDYNKTMNKLKNNYYKSLIIEITNKNFFPRDSMRIEKNNLKKNYERELSLYISKQRNKLNYYDKLLNRIISDRSIKKSLLKLNLSENEISIILYVINNHNITKEKVISKIGGDYNSLYSLEEKDVLYEEDNKLIINSNSSISKEIYNNKKIIRKIISNKRIHIILKIKKANSQTIEWIENQNINIDKKYVSLYKKNDEYHHIFILENDIYTQYKELDKINKICKYIILKKIDDKEIRSETIDLLAVLNKNVNEEGLW